MDIEVMQRKLNDLVKFRDDMLVLVTREGTKEAFDAMVAERRADLAERARLDAEPAITDMNGEPTNDVKEPIAGAGKPAGSGSGDGEGTDPNAKPGASGEPPEGGETKDPATTAV